MHGAMDLHGIVEAWRRRSVEAGGRGDDIHVSECLEWQRRVNERMNE